MRTLKPKNWLEFQHYKSRNPPWIKLHKNLLDDFDFQCLPVASRALAPCLWLLASEHPTGEIDARPESIAFRLRMSIKDVNAGLAPLIESGFFLILADCTQGASAMLAERKQLASESLSETETETETETEREREAERKAETTRSPLSKQSIQLQEIQDAWNDMATTCSVKRSATWGTGTTRRKAALARIKDGWWRENWRAAMAVVATDKFCNGDNDRGWLANIEWFVRPETALKMIEGGYDGKDQDRSDKAPPGADDWMYVEGVPE